MNDEIFDARHQLRRKMLQERELLSETEWLSRSDRIFRLLQTYAPLQDARTVHCYISSPIRREANTEPILAWLLKEGKTVFVPAVRGRTLKLARFHGLDALEISSFGLREPKDAQFIDAPNSIDVVITPLLVCDRFGNRLGYGKGFYDRFFAELSAEQLVPKKIGLAFSFQVVERVPQFRSDIHHDVPLDVIVTDETIIQTIQ